MQTSLSADRIVFAALDLLPRSCRMRLAAASREETAPARFFR
jgi:hypothetical protein